MAGMYGSREKRFFYLYKTPRNTESKSIFTYFDSDIELFSKRLRDASTVEFITTLLRVKRNL